MKSYRGYANDIDKLSVQIWFSSKHNMGFALNLNTWDKIRNCSEVGVYFFGPFNYVLFRRSVISTTTTGIGRYCR